MSQKNAVNTPREKGINGAVHEFQSAIDFFRMEYSEDLLMLFNEFGYLLLCRLVCGEKAEGYREFEDFSNQSGEALLFYINEMERIFRGETGGIDEFSVFRDFRLTIKKNSVLRPILQVVNDLYKLQVQLDDRCLLYDASRRLFDLCVNSNKDRARYALTEDAAKVLMQLACTGREDLEANMPVSVLDPQYGSGNMLIAAGHYFQRARLSGFESDRRLKISAQIFYILSDTEIEVMEEDFLTDQPERKYDMVLANPVFSNETVERGRMDFSLPSELHDIKGKYNLFVVRSLQALEIGGRLTMIVPDSFLFSSKRENVEVRKWILNTYQVEAIVSLPSNTFFPNTRIGSSILMISNQLMKGGWPDNTPYLFFYQMSAEDKDAENEEGYDRWFHVWERRDMYYEEWRSRSEGGLLENYSNIKTPESWEYSDFWFADIHTVKGSKWNLLPDNYKPVKRIELEFEAPETILSGLISDQEDMLDALKELLEEVRDLW